MSWRDAPKVRSQRPIPGPQKASGGQAEPVQWWDARVPAGSELERNLCRSQNGPRWIWDRESVARNEPRGFED